MSAYEGENLKVYIFYVMNENTFWITDVKKTC